MSVNLNKILQGYNTPEREFVQKLAEETPVTVSETDELRKQALAEVSEEATVFARVCAEEWSKIAQEKQALNPSPTPITPTRAPLLQMNPAVQNSIQEDARGADVDKVTAILRSLIRDVSAPGVRTVIEGSVPSQEMMAAPSPVYGMQPTQAEIVSAQQDAKTAEVKHAEVVYALFDHYFGGNQ